MSVLQSRVRVRPFGWLLVGLGGRKISHAQTFSSSPSKQHFCGSVDAAAAWPGRSCSGQVGGRGKGNFTDIFLWRNNCGLTGWNGGRAGRQAGLSKGQDMSADSCYYSTHLGGRCNTEDNSGRITPAPDQLQLLLQHRETMVAGTTSESQSAG